MEKSKLTTPSIVIADDHVLFRQVLTLTLEGAGMEVVHAASNGREAVDAVMEHQPDLVILDIVMPEMDGLAALAILRYIVPKIPVVVVTEIMDPLYLARAGELGAAGYYSKGVKTEELVSGMQAILAGERVHIQAKRTTDPQPPSMPGFTLPKEAPPTLESEDLTDQESLVISFVAMGLDNQSIMDKLYISRNTLKTHMRNIFSKLGVTDRTQAAIWALQHGYHVGMTAEPSSAERVVS
jgi:DNA-binding NarL/FixJ family response regulator